MILDVQEIWAFTVALLDEVHELASDPLADPEAVTQNIEAFFQRLETEHGKATT